MNGKKIHVVKTAVFVSQIMEKRFAKSTTTQQKKTFAKIGIDPGKALKYRLFLFTKKL